MGGCWRLGSVSGSGGVMLWVITVTFAPWDARVREAAMDGGVPWQPHGGDYKLAASLNNPPLLKKGQDDTAHRQLGDHYSVTPPAMLRMLTGMWEPGAHTKPLFCPKKPFFFPKKKSFFSQKDIFLQNAFFPP